MMPEEELKERGVEITSDVTLSLVKAVRPHIAGEVHHLQELQTLEKTFINIIDLQTFYEDLIKFLDSKFAGRTAPLTVDNLQTVDDWVKKYTFPKIAEAEQWIVRGWVIGKLIDGMERETTVPVIPAKLIEVGKLPIRVKDAMREYNLSSREASALEWTVSQSAKDMVNASSITSMRVTNNLFENIRNRQPARALRKALEDEFLNDEGEVNRNWNRVAVTEVNSAFNQGYISQMKQGEWVVGLSLPDRCEQCGKWIDGKAYPVITLGKGDIEYQNMPTKEPEYKKRAWLWENAVWAGKDNVGRRGSPTKQTGEKREHHELFMPSIPMHPYCRCRWVRINPMTQYVKRGEILMKAMYPEDWQEWYSRNVAPVAKEMSKLGLAG